MDSTYFNPRADFCDTLALSSRFATHGTSGGVTGADIDPLEQMALTDRADWALLRLVLCATLATLVLALASTLRA